MLKEYDFRIRNEYYPYTKKPDNTTYYVNGHELNSDSYHTLFDKVNSSIPLDNSMVIIWKNFKTGSHTRTTYLTFIKESQNE